MKCILYNWIIEIHLKYELKVRTLFLLSNIIDRYMQNNIIHKENLQLLGIVALLIASKFEDIYPPEVDELKYLCENQFTKESILELESEIIFEFNFNLIFVSPVDYLEIFIKKHKIRCEKVLKCSYLILTIYLFHPFFLNLIS